MVLDPSKTKVGQSVAQKEGQMLLESRPQPLFNQSGQKRFEHARERTIKHKYPQGTIIPDFIKCPSCDGKPNDIYYLCEAPQKWRILVRCFRCGAKTLPFLPRLAIPIKNSRKRANKAKAKRLQSAMEVSDWYTPDSDNLNKPLDEYLDEQEDVLDDLLNSPMERRIYYVASGLINNQQDRQALLLIVDDTKKILLEETVEDVSLNQAGLIAVRKALELADQNPVLVECSNKYVVNWSRDFWNANHEETNRLKQEVLALTKENSKVEFVPDYRNFAELELNKRLRHNTNK